MNRIDGPAHVQPNARLRRTLLPTFRSRHMPIDTSLIRTDLLAILAVLAERRLEFVRHGPQRAAQLQESRRRPAPHRRRGRLGEGKESVIRHSPDFRQGRGRVARLTGLSNSKSPSSRGKHNRSRYGAAASSSGLGTQVGFPHPLPSASDRIPSSPCEPTVLSRSVWSGEVAAMAENRACSL